MQISRQIIIAIALILLVAACQSRPESGDALAALPDGDASSGETLFAEAINGAPACSTCHVLTDERKVGPGMADYADRAGNTVDGQSAEAYTYEAIINPAAHIVESYGNVMYTEYGRALDDQQVADLIAYLLEQS